MLLSGSAFKPALLSISAKKSNLDATICFIRTSIGGEL